MGFIIVYITYPNIEEAEKISSHLVKEKIVACTNIFPITSCYFWKGSAKNDDEFVSIMKTRAENWDKVKDEVKKLHPYEVPCIMKLNVEANEEFEEWIHSESDG